MEVVTQCIQSLDGAYTPFITMFLFGKKVFDEIANKQAHVVSRGLITGRIELLTTEKRRLFDRCVRAITHATSTNLLYKIVYTTTNGPIPGVAGLYAAPSTVLSIHLVVDCTRFDAAACVPFAARDMVFNTLVSTIESFYTFLQNEWTPELGYDVSPVASLELINTEYIEPHEVVLPPHWPARLPLLPTQVQSLGWMQRFEARIHGEPMVYYSMFVPFLKTSYVYTRATGVGTLLHNDAYVTLSADDSILHQRPLRFNGALLADRTGSGKTATVLALIAAGGRREARIARGVHVVENSWRIPLAATLIIVPLNLVTQWKQEAAKFEVSSRLNMLTVINKRDYSALTIQALRDADIVITTPDFLLGRAYPTSCRVMSHDAMNALSNTIRSRVPCNEIVFQVFLWRRLVFDEHHENGIATHCMLHTSNSSTTQFVRNLQAEVHWGLSGTPHPLYLMEPMRCRLQNLSATDALFMESRQRVLLEHGTRRSPYVNDLPAPIHNTTIVPLAPRELEMLRAYSGMRDPSWQVQLSTTFNAAAFDHVPGGAALDDTLAAMTLTQLSQVMVSRRTTQLTQKAGMIRAETMARDEKVRTLSRIRETDSLNVDDPEFRPLSDAEHAAGSRGTTAEAVLVFAIRQHQRTLQSLQAEHTQLQAQHDFFYAQLNMDEEQKTCPICINAVSTVITSCGHWFCKECSLQYLRTQPAVDWVKCPLCNTRSSRRGWTEMQEREVAAAAQHTDGSNSPVYGSKLQRIGQLLRRINTEGEKAIMFVEWSGLMRAIRAILTTAGIRVGVISGNCNTRASAIQKMQSGELDVLLMSLESSTSGLNLVAANHVIFPHAFVNVPPGAVEQAIARVHRLGQTKQVYVHTFIAEGPEQQIHEQQR